MALSRASRRGWLRLGALVMPCALGRSGSRVMKREGDGATPIGRYAIRALLYRPDRGVPAPSWLPRRALGRRHGWSDDPCDRNYNRPVRRPYPASAEELWRNDRLYDHVIVIDHNERPRIRGHGSAVFMHVARPDMAPTAGCVALKPSDMRRLLARLRRPAELVIRF
ncbi:MAG TPA: L,D-transpeptidase family protein [Hyphomicrobiaceae bacterium]|nr:L,D-transpeptidase family protein [Hyphomicrobiaceae bacterium]